MRFILPSLLLAACSSELSWSPTADAGPDQIVAPGADAVLDGSGSQDADGVLEGYQWRLLSAPEGDGVSMEGSTEEVASLTTAAVGRYVLSLTVTDDEGNTSSPDIVVIEARPGNERPDAVLVLQGDVGVGAELILDGSGSTDPEGASLGYAFSVQVAPAGAAGAIVAGTEPSLARLTPDVAGTWVLGLAVDDGQLQSRRTDVVVDVGTTVNQAPVAECPPAQSQLLPGDVSLDGSGSFDPEGESLQFSWSLVEAPAGSGAPIVDATSAVATLRTDIDGAYVVRLRVSDGVTSDACTTTVTIGEVIGKEPPVCDAGDDVVVELGDAVTLDGSGTYDPEGTIASWSWALTRVPADSVASLTDGDTASPTLVPDVVGEYEVTLTASDGSEECSDTVIVTVTDESINTPPVCDGGVDVEVAVGETAAMDASGTYDPDGDGLSFRWTIASAPSGSTATLSRAYSRYAEITPDVEGEYELLMTVKDGTDSCTDTVIVTATDESVNTPPVCDGGDDVEVAVGETAAMDASGTYDPDGDGLSFRWTIASAPSGSTATLSRVYSRYAEITPDIEGEYELLMTVKDGTDSCTDTVIVTATDSTSENTPPIADAGDDHDSCALDTFTLDGSGSSDADGDSLTYLWSFSSLPTGSSLTDADITGSTSASASFTADVEGVYELTLTVDDGTDSDTDTVTATVDGDDTVLVLHLDETSGATAADSSSTGNDGVVSGGTWSGGRFFGDLAFDGSSTQLGVPDDDTLDFTDEFSVDFWMKSDSAPASYQLLFAKGTYNYSLFAYAGTLYFWGLQDTGSYLTATGSATGLGDGQWHHYAVTFDGSDVVIYEDGVDIGSATASGALVPNSSVLNIGHYVFGSTTYYVVDGEIDEFVVRSRALTDAEVADLADATEQFCTGDSDVDPPAVSIASPSDGASTDAAVVKLEGTVSDDSDIVAIDADGETVVAESDDYGTWSAWVTLAEGSNTITVTAEDAAGNVGSDSVTVTYADTCGADVDLLLAFQEEESGTATDWSPNGLDATDIGSERIAGVAGNALLLDGSTSYAVVPDDDALDKEDEFSIELWFQRDGATSDYEVLLTKGTSGPNYMVLLNGRWVGWGYVDSTGTSETVASAGWTDGDWHHLVGVYDGSSIYLYVDGALEDSATVTSGPVANSQALYIGAYGSSGYALDGAIDQVILWDEALTASDVADRYAEGEACATSENYALAGTPSSSDDWSFRYDAENVIDDSTAESSATDATFWLLPDATPGWVEVDLGMTVGITSVRWANTHNATRYTRAATDYEIYVSTTGDFDGEEELFATGTGDLETNLVFHTEDATGVAVGQYVRFYVTDYYGYGGGINELQVFGAE